MLYLYVSNIVQFRPQKYHASHLQNLRKINQNTPRIGDLHQVTDTYIKYLHQRLKADIIGRRLISRIWDQHQGFSLRFGDQNHWSTYIKGRRTTSRVKYLHQRVGNLHQRSETNIKGWRNTSRVRDLYEGSETLHQLPETYIIVL